MGAIIVLAVVFVLLLSVGVYLYAQTPEQQAIRTYSPQDYAKYIIVKDGYAESVDQIHLDTYDVRAGAAQGRHIGADIFKYDFTIHGPSGDNTCNVTVENDGANSLLGITYNGEVMFAV